MWRHTFGVWCNKTWLDDESIMIGGGNQQLVPRDQAKKNKVRLTVVACPQLAAAAAAVRPAADEKPRSHALASPRFQNITRSNLFQSSWFLQARGAAFRNRENARLFFHD
ncbi:uncharacterized protein UV8b_00285 [Ustilaginoidea virens]|uniref:Uncharacterized protein n=1 Tax=Ustilaginoidea virens TaxID=1159556 RepID=A0A8E5HIJ8_USTVR|nr:uncharacterized protein UV8b_00285 [Ustilaginoidea virens]QUC16044.1 hypothetical protein UV8b_00285 [Ustilaginoidea virens]